MTPWEIRQFRRQSLLRPAAPAMLRHMQIARAVLVLNALCCCHGIVAADANDALRVDAAFPGGNIVVEAIEGDTVALHQDLRDTRDHWFYWCFRVQGAAGRTLDFKFTRGNVIGVRGPAVSTDHGRTWRWLGAEAVNDSTFRFHLPSGAQEARFCMTIPYLEANLRQFLARYRDSPGLRADVLCKTKKGREVELLHLGRLDGQCRFRVLLAARHHACETMASYGLEGILESVLADTDEGRWFRQQVEFLVVPFMDKDGVEEGDQGKGRQPRDHNEDYAGESSHASVRALRDLVPRWSQGRLRLALDMHCPSIRGGWHEQIYFVCRRENAWPEVQHFSAILKAVQTGPLRFNLNATDSNAKWRTSPDSDSAKFAGWAGRLPGVRLATTIEIPYANAGGGEVTAETARALGRDVARAVRRFLESGVM